MAEEKTIENSLVMTTKRVDEIRHRENMGAKLKREEKLWFSGIKDVRKADLTFAMTDDEVQEYLKCKLSVQYFAEKYCKIKREDGSIGSIKLRDYQKRIMDLYVNNRFSILMASRQTGKCNLFSIKVLQENDGLIEEITLGELYFNYLISFRKLTFLEKIKYFLYKLYIKLDTYPI